MLVVATALLRADTVLAQQRAYPPEDANGWEFPGGRVEAGESEPDAVHRECLEELGVAVRAGHRIGPAVPLREGLVLHLWTARLLDDTAEPRAIEHRGVRWLTAEELDGVDWLATDRRLVPELRAHLLG